METVLVALMVVVAVFSVAGWIVTLSWVLPAVGERYLSRKVDARMGHVTSR